MIVDGASGMARDRSKYRMVVDELAIEILNGDLVSGDPFYSRQAICARFGLSPVTAFKVQRDLKDRGLIAAAPGRGFFVSQPRAYAKSGIEEIRRVRTVGSPQAIGPDTILGRRILDGMDEACAERGWGFEVEYVQVLNNPGGVINSRRRLAPDEALAVMLHSLLLPEIVTLLMAPQVRAVTIGQTFPGRTAVLVDNDHGMGQLVGHVAARGARRVLYAGLFGYMPALTNASERHEAFLRHAARLGLEAETEMSGNYHTLAERVRAFAPDALMFANDDSALHFRAHYLSACAPARPYVTGFDGIATVEPGLETLATYRIDAEEIGRRAVRMLLRPQSQFQQPVYERVPGRLSVPGL